MTCTLVHCASLFCFFYFLLCLFVWVSWSLTSDEWPVSTPNHRLQLLSHTLLNVHTLMLREARWLRPQPVHSSSHKQGKERCIRPSANPLPPVPASLRQDKSACIWGGLCSGQTASGHARPGVGRLMMCESIEGKKVVEHAFLLCEESWEIAIF